jgi:hypothetical protein
MTLTSRNHWSTSKDHIVLWSCRFSPEVSRNPEKLLSFVSQLLTTGERERVYRVLEAPALSYKAGEGQSYLEHIRGYFMRTERLPLFYLSFPDDTRGSSLRVSGQIAYYDVDGIREEELEDLGALLGHLRPQETKEYPSAAYSVHPVSVYTSSFYSLGGPGMPVDKDAAITLMVMLYSDIWFPRVTGVYDSDVPNDPRRGLDGWYDNRELASRHTSRFNRFLASVRAAALELGASWKLDRQDGNKNFIAMCSDTGINLADEPAVQA